MTRAGLKGARKHTAGWANELFHAAYLSRNSGVLLHAWDGFGKEGRQDPDHGGGKTGTQGIRGCGNAGDGECCELRGWIRIPA